MYYKSTHYHGHMKAVVGDLTLVPGLAENREVFRNRFDRAEVVAVQVGDDDKVDAFEDLGGPHRQVHRGIEGAPGERGARVPRGQVGVDEDAPSGDLEHERAPTPNMRNNDVEDTVEFLPTQGDSFYVIID